MNVKIQDETLSGLEGTFNTVVPLTSLYIWGFRGQVRQGAHWTGQEETGTRGVATSRSAVLLNDLGKLSTSWTES